MHYASNVLEATLKVFLERQNCHYQETDTLAQLWKTTAGLMNMKPQAIEDKNWKKIVSGLFNIVDGLRELRNKKSAAHGRSFFATPRPSSDLFSSDTCYLYFRKNGI